MKMIRALAISEIRLTLRRSEALLVNLIVPIAVLIALSQSSTGVDRALAFAYFQTVLGTSLLSLGISTGFDRRYRVLVRLGTTPLGRRGLVAAKILSLVFVQTLQLIVLSIVAAVMGWRPGMLWIGSFPLCWVSSCAFAGIALFIAGRVKAELNLGLQNLVYMILIALGALVFSDTSRVPTSLHDFALIIPSGALHTLLRWLGGEDNFSLLAACSLASWSVVLPVVASRKFRFDE